MNLSTRDRRAGSTSSGAKTTTRPSVVAGVTIVRAESDVGFPNGPSLIDQRDPAGEMHRVLADSGVFLTVASEPHRDRAVDVAAIVRPYGNWSSTEHQLITSTSELMRGSAPLFTDTAKQRFVRWTCLGRIDAHALVHRPHRYRFGRRIRANLAFGLRQQIIEPRIAIDDCRAFPPDHSGPHDRPQLVGAGELVHGGRFYRDDVVAPVGSGFEPE